MTRTAVLLDFYDTLVVLDEDRPEMWQSLSDLGYRCTKALELLFNSDGHNGEVTPAASAYAGWRADQLRLLAGLVGVPSERAQQVVQLLLDIDSQWTVKAKAGAHELVDWLRSEGFFVGICSNWDYALEPYLAQAGLPLDLPYITSADCGVRKPHPGLLTSACERWALDLQRTIYVGDNLALDVTCALRAGATPIWLTDDEAPAGGHVRTVRRLSDLPPLLVELTNAWLETEAPAHG